MIYFIFGVFVFLIFLFSAATFFEVSMLRKDLAIKRYYENKSLMREAESYYNSLPKA